MAKAWTWFMLTLNWSCNIRARSSHMLASVSFLLRTIFLFRYQNNQTDPITPTKTNKIRSFLLHIPLTLEEPWEWCCCFCCWCSWDCSCCWICFFFGYLHNLSQKPEILQLIIIPTKTHQHIFNKQILRLSQCSLQFLGALVCKISWSNLTQPNKFTFQLCTAQ